MDVRKKLMTRPPTSLERNLTLTGIQREKSQVLAWRHLWFSKTRQYWNIWSGEKTFLRIYVKKKREKYPLYVRIHENQLVRLFIEKTFCYHGYILLQKKTKNAGHIGDFNKLFFYIWFSFTYHWFLSNDLLVFCASFIIIHEIRQKAPNHHLCTSKFLLFVTVGVFLARRSTS